MEFHIIFTPEFILLIIFVCFLNLREWKTERVLLPAGSLPKYLLTSQLVSEGGHTIPVSQVGNKEHNSLIQNLPPAGQCQQAGGTQR